MGISRFLFNSAVSLQVVGTRVINTISDVTWKIERAAGLNLARKLHWKGKVLENCALKYEGLCAAIAAQAKEEAARAVAERKEAQANRKALTKEAARLESDYA